MENADFYFRLLTSLSQVVGIWIAVITLLRWRSELFAKRRIELCEDVLALLYEVRDALTAIRSPFMWGGEGEVQSLPGAPPVVQSEDQRMVQAYLDRVEKHKDTFTRLNSLRYRFMAIYGSEWSRQFQTFVGIAKRVLVSAAAIRDAMPSTRYYGRHGEQRQQEAYDRLEENQAMIWSGHQRPDLIDQEIEIATLQLEAKCREEITKSSSILYHLVEKLRALS